MERRNAAATPGRSWRAHGSGREDLRSPGSTLGASIGRASTTSWTRLDSAALWIDAGHARAAAVGAAHASPASRLGTAALSARSTALGCAGRSSPARCARPALVALLAQQWLFSDRVGRGQSVLG